MISGSGSAECDGCAYETHDDFTNFSDKLFFFIWICWSLSIWREFERRTARSEKKLNSFRHVLRKWNLFDKHTFQSQFHVIDFYSNISMDIYHFLLFFLSFNNLTNFFLVINVAKLPLGLLAQFHAYSSDYFVKLHPHLKLLLMLQPEMKIDVWYVIIM